MCNNNDIFNLEFNGVDLEFDISNKKLKLNSERENMLLELSPTSNQKIFSAFLDNLVYLNMEKKDVEDKKDNMLYLSSRNFMTRDIRNSKMYMDILIYNSDEDVLYKNALNRSQGHCNDVREIEVHQVLSGEVLCLLRSPEGEDYYGFFSAGEYVEIPSGWFHCTYVTQNTTVVANFYCNAYWEDNIANKPYFEVENNVCVEKSESKDEYVLMKKGINKSAELNNSSKDTFSELGLQPYSNLYELGILKNDYSKENASIFDLFYSIEL